MADFDKCPYREGIMNTLTLHDVRLTKVEDCIKDLEAKQTAMDAVLTRLEKAVESLTKAIYWFIGTVVVVPVCIAIVNLVLKH